MKNFLTNFGKKKNDNAETNNQIIEESINVKPSLEAQPEPSGSENINQEAEPASEPPVHKGKRKKKPWSKKKKIIVFSILGVLFAAIVGVGIYISVLYNNPMSAFVKVADQMTASPSAANTASTSESPTEPVSTDPYDKLKGQADTGMLKDIVNILLIGVDHAEERDEWKGKKAFHADVLIVLAINTKTSEVNMISIPRDTWVEMPGVKGIYKANACIDCGGGWPTKDNPTDGGFKKACELASLDDRRYCCGLLLCRRYGRR